MSCKSFALTLPKSNLSLTTCLGLRTTKVPYNLWLILLLQIIKILLTIYWKDQLIDFNCFKFLILAFYDTEAVFAQTKPIVTSVLDGYNVCIFAYGQTGTGKTFTMEGTLENRGVNYRTLEELFRISDERGGIMRYELFVSMLEVYNEKIRDLLIDNSNQPAKKWVLFGFIFFID